MVSTAEDWSIGIGECNAIEDKGMRRWRGVLRGYSQLILRCLS
jgi:hypothetical protein